MAKAKAASKKNNKKAAPVATAAVAIAQPPPRHVYRWDLDKTYLKTEFDTVMQLLRSAFENAADKRSVPGAAALLRELRAGAEGGLGPSRICFISGSPRQMRKVLTEKLHLDGVEFDEFILKPNLRNMLTGRWAAMREQVGYKLPALLAGRSGLPPEIRETCFGDDAEADCFIYSLYADILAGKIERNLLEELLLRAGCYADDAQRAISLAETLPQAPAVDRIFIHLDRKSPTVRFERYGARVVPIYNYFQAALVLFELRQLSAAAVLRVALEMVVRSDYTLFALKNSLQDLLRRGCLVEDSLGRMGEQLRQEEVPQIGARPEVRELITLFAAQVAELGNIAKAARPVEQPIDYIAALEADLPHSKRR